MASNLRRNGPMLAASPVREGRHTAVLAVVKLSHPVPRLVRVTFLAGRGPAPSEIPGVGAWTEVGRVDVPGETRAIHIVALPNTSGEIRWRAEGALTSAMSEWIRWAFEIGGGSGGSIRFSVVVHPFDS